jgi:hypothetical protein
MVTALARPSRLAACAGLLWLGTGAAPALAVDATPLTEGEAQLAHFAFASQLGSGVYAVSGRTIQIYRLPLGWDVAEPAGRRPGLRLRLPTTIGLYDFKARDVIDSGLPDQLDTLTLALGAELDFVLGEWHLLPYVEAGRAWDAGGDADATLYSASVHARRDWSRDEYLWRFSSGVAYAGLRLDGSGEEADLLRLEAGFESRRPVGFDLAGHAAEGGAYLLAEWYADRAEEAVVHSSGDERIPAQLEIGLTLGTRPVLELWGLPLPRVGLAYRFGDGVSVYRLVFGSPF